MANAIRPRRIELPEPLSSFIGRERELADIVGLIRDRAHRIVTLTGPGGVGKTRLAIRAAALSGEDFQDDGAFVDLAPISDPAHVSRAIADVLGLKNTGDDLVAALIERIGGASALLVLDNFEHLIPAAADVAKLLSHCPRLTVLATSRIPLRISGEQEYAVPPFACGDTKANSTAIDTTIPEAVQLFSARAQEAKFDFELTKSNASAVLDICRTLDGLPLAVELAAARVRTLSPDALLTRLKQRLPTLTGGRRDAPVRQRTMRDTIGWSYDLLEPYAQALFRRLGVFVDGFDLQAAETVAGSAGSLEPRSAGSPPGSKTPSPATFDGVAALVESSLLQHVGDVVGVPRYAMLETVREFALESLEATVELENTRNEHVEYFSALADIASPLLLVPGQEMWLERLEAEHDNFTAALTWLEHREDHVGIVRLAGALGNFWLLHTYYTEGRRWLEPALANARNVPPEWLARALGAIGLLSMYQQDDRGRALLEQSGELWRDLGYEAEFARMVLGQGVHSGISGDLATAIELTERALDQFRTIGDKAVIAPALLTMSLSNLGQFTCRFGEVNRGTAHLEDALVMQRSIGYAWGAAITLARLGDAAWSAGKPSQATAYYLEGVRFARLLRDWRVVCWNLAGIAVILTNRDSARSKRLVSAVKRIVELTGQSDPVVPVMRRDDKDVVSVRTALASLTESATGDRSFTVDQAFAEAMAALDDVIAPETSRAAPDLTLREREVLKLIVVGNTDRQIAEALFISRRTAAGHVANILSKLGLPSRSAAAAFAVRNNLA